MSSRRPPPWSVFFLALAACGLGPWAGAPALGSESLDAAPTFNAYNFTVHINTGTLAGKAAFLDVQFNPTNTQSPGTASLSVNNFATDGSTNAPSQTFGDASGSLATGLSFDNKTQRNGFLQPFLFGQSISFDVHVTGVTPGAAPSTVLVFLFDNPDTRTGFNTGPGGAIVTIDDIFGDNPTATAAAFAPTTSPGPTATIDPLAATPEPATFLPACLAAGAYFCYRWRRSHRGPPHAPPSPVSPDADCRPSP